VGTLLLTRQCCQEILEKVSLFVPILGILYLSEIIGELRVFCHSQEEDSGIHMSYLATGKAKIPFRRALHSNVATFPCYLLLPISSSAYPYRSSALEKTHMLRFFFWIAYTHIK